MMKTIKIPVAEYENMKAEIEKLKGLLKEGDINRDIHFDCYNERAFWKDFNECFSAYPCVLITFNINVEKVNEKYGRETGTKVIAEIVRQLKEKGVAVYHIQGEKFNIFYKQWESETLQNLWDLEMDEEYEVSIYIGEIKSIDCKGVSAEELKDIAVKMMYKDKKIKRPKNKNILRIEAENKRLEEAIEANQKLIDKVNSFDEENEKAKKKALALQNKKGLDDMLKISARAKEKQEKEEKEIYLAECSKKGIIPYTTEYVDDTDERPLDTIWYSKSEFRYEVSDDAYKTTFYVFPLSFSGVEKSLDILVAIENNGEFEIVKGNMLEYGFNTIKVVISARFDKNGKFITNISFPNKATVISQKCDTHDSKFTSKHFGKTFEGKQIFPLRTGLNGYCECVILEDDNCSLSRGVIMENEKSAYVHLTDEKIYIERKDGK